MAAQVLFNAGDATFVGVKQIPYADVVTAVRGAVQNEEEESYALHNSILQEADEEFGNPNVGERKTIRNKEGKVRNCQ